MQILKQKEIIEERLIKNAERIFGESINEKKEALEDTMILINTSDHLKTAFDFSPILTSFSIILGKEGLSKEERTIVLKFLEGKKKSKLSEEERNTLEKTLTFLKE